jgi:hypothetical protein
LTSYADGFDEPEHGWKTASQQAIACICPEKLPKYTPKTRAERTFTPCLANTAQTTAPRNRLQPSHEPSARLYGEAWEKGTRK